MNINVETGTLNNIPYMLYSPESNERKPLVIFSHGFSSVQYDGASLALQLAQIGFNVLTYDLADHGARYNGFLEKLETDSDMGMSLLRTIEDSYHDLEFLIGKFSLDHRVDDGKIGLVGYSLGAMLSLYAMKKNSVVTSCVSIIGTPDFVQQIVYGMEKESEQDFITEAEREVLEYAKRLDPYHHLVYDETRPLLIINASKDDDIPPNASESFFIKVKPRYEQNSGTIEYYLADEYHYVNDDMMQRTINWFKNVYGTT